MEAVQSEIVYNFIPQPGPQTELYRSPVQDIFFGGARGGGKTAGFVGLFPAKAYRANEFCKKRGIQLEYSGMLFRQHANEMEDLIKEAHKQYQGLARYVGHPYPRFVFHEDGPFGPADLSLLHIRTTQDAKKHQGKNRQFLAVDEAGNYPLPDPIDLLRGTLRSAIGVKTFFGMAANPGGSGHNWLKQRYIDPAPPGEVFKAYEGGRFIGYRQFIPSRLEDNRLLMENDPDYERQLQAAVGGKDWLWQAWRYGSWDISAGGMFDDIWRRSIHVLKPFKLPRGWDIYRSYDWGSSAPFSIGWWAITDGAPAEIEPGVYKQFPRDTMIRVAEWYGWNGNANQGLRMLERDIAEGVLQREALFDRPVKPGPADTNLFIDHQGKRLANEHSDRGIYWTHPDKGSGTRVLRWQLMRQRLQAAYPQPHEELPEGQPFVMEQPGMFVFENCHNWIRTVPTIPRDELNPDDVNTAAEDHCADETGLMTLSRPFRVEKMEIAGF